MKLELLGSFPVAQQVKGLVLSLQQLGIFYMPQVQPTAGLKSGAVTPRAWALPPPPGPPPPPPPPQHTHTTKENRITFVKVVVKLLEGREDWYLLYAWHFAKYPRFVSCDTVETGFKARLA